MGKRKSKRGGSEDSIGGGFKKFKTGPSTDFTRTTRSTNFTLADIVFDLEKHCIETRNRLASAADFVLKYEFDIPRLHSDFAMKDPSLYTAIGHDNRKRFLGARLMSINMVCLEDAIIKSFPNGIYSDEELELVIKECLTKKENEYKTQAKRRHPKGTRVTDDMIAAGMKIEIRAQNRESVAECSICLKSLDGIIIGRFGEMKNHKHSIATLICCGHEFHQYCITEWLNKNDNARCPLCRQWALAPQFEYPKWINDLNKVRDFLTRDRLASFQGERRYIISLSVLHAVMADYLDGFGMPHVKRAFLNQISVIMEGENETEMNDIIKEEAIDFLKDSRTCKGDLLKLFVRFNKFIRVMLRALRVDSRIQIEFDEKEKELNRWRVVIFSDYLLSLVESVVYKCD